MPGTSSVTPTPASDPGKDAASVKDTGTFASLRYPNFRLLLTGTTLSNAAQWIQQVTLSWLVFDLTNSGTMLGAINIVRSISMLGLVPFAGVIIDRVNRRTIMLLTNSWLFLITLALGVILLFSGAHIAMLFVFAFLAGIAAAFDQPIRQVVVFQLVPLPVAPNAVALVQTGWALMRSLGPGIGGFLILWFGAGGNFLVQAAAYGLIAVTIMQMQFPPRKPDTVGTSPLQNIREGIRFAAKQKVTRTFMMMGWILPVFIIPNYSALPPIYAKDVFHGGPEVLGFLLASVGVGGIGGGVVSASLGKFERRGLLQLASLFLLGLSLIGFAFSTTLVVALPLLALSGFFEMIFLTTNQTLLQLSIPDNLRGRVTSVVNLNAALSPFGAFVAGAGSDMLGGPKIVTVILCGLASAIAVGVFLFSPTVRDYRMSQGMNHAAASRTASPGK